ncbi:ABC transporter ATP-binding protein [Gorillibacterium sp. CAU 1737]|uniref:ABC transporter ATP-binding protein n=1 Tax=Gorillibacterium sp. CAU 1737 TaxID=3140362 RepID=UPI003261C993
MKRYIRAIRQVALMDIIFSGLYSLMLAFMPYLQKLLFDGKFGFHSQGLLLLGSLYLGCMLLSAIFQYISQTHTWKTGVAFHLAVKSDLFRALSQYSFKRFSKRDKGEYTSMLNNDVQLLSTQFVDAFVDIIKSGLMLVISAIFVFLLVDYRIAIVLLASSLLAVFVPRLMSDKLSNTRKMYQEQLGHYFSRIQDLWEGFKRIHAVNREHVNEVHEGILQETEGKKLAFGIRKTLANIVNGFVMDFVKLMAFLTVGYLLIRGKISVGTGIATFGYVESFIYPIRYILNDVNDIHSTREVKKKLLGFLEEEKEERPVIAEFRQDIEFKGVEARLEHFCLAPFHFTFERGKAYAIIGRSGSGKSTLLDAFMGYVDLEQGCVLVDGEDTTGKDLSPICFHLDQRAHLFADTLEQNGTDFGSYPSERVDGELAKLRWEKLSRLKTERNVQVASGGEKQGIHFLRLLVADSPILLLDEPFSAMDEHRTDIMLRHLLSLEDKTIILITHKLSKAHLEQFDEILLLENGVLKQSGSWEKIEISPEFGSLSVGH